MKPSPAGTREIALGLAEAVLPALRAGAPVVANAAARDVARLMGFTGLEAALAELARHLRAPWPVDVENLAGRIERMAATTAHDGELTAFLDGDRELGAMAAQLAQTEWSAPEESGDRSVATIPAEEAFAGFALEATAEALRARMTMTVASAVRAAADWLGAEEHERATLAVHDSALTLTLASSHAGGMGPAGAVLAAVEGSLGRDPDGRWTIRVATSAERASYLLLRQGRHGVALPWHAVARLRMFSPDELERLAEPRLAPLGTGGAHAGEQPAALVALGLARAWFVADRIVWRIAAQAREADAPGPFAACTRMVEVESGERYWVLEPAWLLRGVTPMSSPPPVPRPRAGVAPAPSQPEIMSPQASVPHVEPAPPALPAPPTPSALAPLAPPESTAPPAAPAPAGDALAVAVERALAQLRSERGVAALPESRPWVPVTPPSPTAAPIVTPPPIVQPAPPVTAPAPSALDDAGVAGLLDSLLPALPDVAPPPARAAAPSHAMPAPEPAEPASAPRASELAARVPVRRALVADDSLVARIFLARLLEKRGWIVESVADAASLWDELHHGPWALVCADISMPDAQGASHVSRLVQFLGRRAEPTPCIVLTRDAADERIAREAGATLVLRKPFEDQRLDELLQP